MGKERTQDLAARLAAWHNRHPLALRVAATDVQSIGWVALPFRTPDRADEPAATPPAAAGKSLRERAIERARSGDAGAPPAPATTARAEAGAAASPRAGRRSSRRWQAAFSEDFIAPLSPRQVARFAIRHGLDDAPGDALPVREVLADAAAASGAGATPARLWLLSAAIEKGGRRVRVLVAPEDGRVLGPRLTSAPRRAVGAALGALALAVAVGLGWNLQGDVDAAGGSPASRQDAAAVAKAAPKPVAESSRTASRRAAPDAQAAPEAAVARAAAATAASAARANLPDAGGSRTDASSAATGTSAGDAERGAAADPSSAPPTPPTGAARAAPQPAASAPRLASAASAALARAMPSNRPVDAGSSAVIVKARPPMRPLTQHGALGERPQLTPALNEAAKAAARAAVQAARDARAQSAAEAPRPSPASRAAANAATLAAAGPAIASTSAPASAPASATVPATTSATASASSSAPARDPVGHPAPAPSPAVAALPAPAPASTPALAAAAGASAVKGAAWAISTRVYRTRFESEQMLVAMRDAAARSRSAGPLRFEVLPAGDDWRAVGWPFAERQDADRVRHALAERGLRVDVVPF